MVLVIGSITTLFMALVAIVQYDIKRVVAYSTLSQLGYMTMALGASAYPAAIFHLMTHAFFKAVLFLGAGSVIIAMHHEQDMRKMGGLKKYMPITYWTMFVAALANAGVLGFSGFFSKEAIIEAVHFADIPGAGFAYFCAVATVLVTGFYTFRLLFMTFHGAPRMDHHTEEHLHESPWVVTLPLVALAIPSIGAGWLIGPLLFGDYFANTIQIAPQHEAMAKMAAAFHGIPAMMSHALSTVPFWLSVAGIFAAWYLYIAKPDLPGKIKRAAGAFATLLERKYFIDELYSWLFAGGARLLGRVLWKFGDVKVIDGFFVNGAAGLVAGASTLMRRFQTGYIYHYAFTMIVGVFILMSLWLFW
jgi:NADH-quinone oxidoreductase subunit L